MDDTTNHEEELAAVDPSERVLLLPHCLRPSETCPGKYSKLGLVCPDDCTETCAIRVLRNAALKVGYKGICVAPGGSMVLRFVKKLMPRAIVAVACPKELELGLKGVEEIARDEAFEMPTVVVIPLSKDGCVDTEVDLDYALAVVSS
jgi:hypothetical protein